MAWLVGYIGILHVSVAAIKASTNYFFLLTCEHLHHLRHVTKTNSDLNLNSNPKYTVPRSVKPLPISSSPQNLACTQNNLNTSVIHFSFPGPYQRAASGRRNLGVKKPTLIPFQTSRYSNFEFNNRRHRSIIHHPPSLVLSTTYLV